MDETETQLAVVPVETQDALQAAKRVVNKKAVQAELAKKINEAYTTYVKSNDEIFALALTIENRRILLGTYLNEAKTVVGHGRFKKWIEDNFKDFSYRSATRYMQFAKVAGYKQLDTVHNLREYQKVLVSLGLREPAEGQGQQQLVDYNYFAVFTKTCLMAAQKFKEVFEHQPLDDIDEDTREQLKQQLAPIVAIYENL